MSDQPYNAYEAHGDGVTVDRPCEPAEPLCEGAEDAPSAGVYDNVMDNANCSVAGCRHEALVAETVIVRGLEMWTYICGPHMQERRGRGE